MNVVVIAIDSVLLLGILGVSAYAASALPADARLPTHFGPGGFGNWVPKKVGLVLWPAAAVVLYVVLVVSARAQQADGGSGQSLPVGLTAALALMLVNHVAAIRAALNRGGRA